MHADTHTRSFKRQISHSENKFHFWTWKMTSYLAMAMSLFRPKVSKCFLFWVWTISVPFLLAFLQGWHLQPNKLLFCFFPEICQECCLVWYFVFNAIIIFIIIYVQIQFCGHQSSMALFFFPSLTLIKAFSEREYCLSGGERLKCRCPLKGNRYGNCSNRFTCNISCNVRVGTSRRSFNPWQTSLAKVYRH